jgi:hypothetical protein
MATAAFALEPPEFWSEIQSRRGAQKSRLDERRRFVRFWFPSRCVLELGPSLPAVPRAREFHQVWTRDVSRGGMSFLHSGQLYPGERVRLWLSSGKLECAVERCQRHNPHCWEIGAEITRIENHAAAKATSHGARPCGPAPA